MKTIVTSIFLVLCLSHIIYGKDSVAISTGPVIEVLDTAKVKNLVGLEEDSLRYSDVLDVSNIDTKPHSPLRAAMLSAAFPGLGQIYNKKYWKLAIVYGGIAGFVAYYDYSSSRYNLYRDAFYELSVNGQLTNEIIKTRPSHLAIFNNGGAGDLEQEYEVRKDLFRKYRDQTVIYFVIFYILNIVDANVDAYFMKYDVNENLALQAHPIVGTSFSKQYAGLQLNLTLK